MAIDAGKTALTYCHNAAPAIKCVRTRCVVIKYRLIDGDRVRERDGVPEMGRIWDKRKMKEKKEGGRERRSEGGWRSQEARSVRDGHMRGKRKENPKSVRLRERRSIAISGEYR